MDNISQIIGNVVVVIGVIFMFFGFVGISRFNNFYTRLLAASKTDTVGALTVVIGVAILHGFSFFTGKVVLLGIIMLIFNPLVAHILARSAYLSGQRDDNEEKEEKEAKKIIEDENSKVEDIKNGNSIEGGEAK